MFFVTQLIGLAVINAYMPTKTVEVNKGGISINKTVGGNVSIPYGMQPPKELELKPAFSFWNILISIAFAILIFIILTKLKANLVIKVWFISVIFLTISIALSALLSYLPFSWPFDKIALVLAIPLTYYKVLKRNLIVHNLTELLIYPGLAAVFVPILNVTFTIILLIIIAIYDIYAVWHSKIMIKMAKYQINNLKVFTGFFLPYVNKKAAKELQKIKMMKKTELKNKNVRARMKKIKISLAILGGGDVAFPLIFAGVIMRTYSFFDALIVAVAATASLLLLFIAARKEKFYPAMPFLSAGCIVGYLLSLLI